MISPLGGIVIEGSSGGILWGGILGADHVGGILWGVKRSFLKCLVGPAACSGRVPPG